MTQTQTLTTSFFSLRQEAERQGIVNFSKMRKAELETALSQTNAEEKGVNVNDAS